MSRILLDSVVAGHWHTQVIGGAAPLSDRELQGDFIQMLFPGKIALQADTYLPDASASSGISAPADVARAGRFPTPQTPMRHIPKPQSFEILRDPTGDWPI
ncbi:hypothetical protein CIRG_06205 [Coccidioides immitis RMSCC 2394]|uniref:Uncharacterized protein n=1 Tax=Coccidioides immitis RMSCC 2394 TaxID=404692 RepID=A0A0J6YHI6_COCIT|nr:hypothetical protein CIRG_06205 [Coccidioides immitis RMSCC 2394]